MNDTTLAAYLRLFINRYENIASLWDGKSPGQVEDDAHEASELMALAQPLLDRLTSKLDNAPGI